MVPVVENSPRREKPEKTRLRWPGAELVRFPRTRLTRPAGKEDRQRVFLGPVRPDPEQPANGGEGAGAGAGVPGDALRLEPSAAGRGDGGGRN